MNNIHKTLIAGAVAIVLGFLLFAPSDSPISIGGAGLGTYLQVATTTAIGPEETNTLFSANNFCRARAITTVGEEITITFGDPTNTDVSSSTLSDVIGHVQAASTTVIYSSDDVGCGRWTGHAEASTTITTSSF